MKELRIDFTTEKYRARHKKWLDNQLKDIKKKDLWFGDLSLDCDDAGYYTVTDKIKFVLALYANIAKCYEYDDERIHYLLPGELYTARGGMFKTVFDAINWWLNDEFVSRNLAPRKVVLGKAQYPAYWDEKSDKRGNVSWKMRNRPNRDPEPSFRRMIRESNYVYVGQKYSIMSYLFNLDDCKNTDGILDFISSPKYGAIVRHGDWEIN